MPTFEEAIRDHLRLTGDALVSDEQGAEALDRARPPGGAPSAVPRPEGYARAESAEQSDTGHQPDRATDRLRRYGSRPGAGGSKRQDGTSSRDGGHEPTGASDGQGSGDRAFGPDLALAFAGGEGSNGTEDGDGFRLTARRNGSGVAVAPTRARVGGDWEWDDAPAQAEAQPAEASGPTGLTVEWPRLEVTPNALLVLQGVLALIAALLVNAGLMALDADRIAPGVRIGGVDVGGMSARSAESALDPRLAAAAATPLSLTSGGRSWRFPASAAHPSPDVPAAVRAAIARTRREGYFTRAAHFLPGGALNADVAAPVAVREPVLNGFVGGIARAVDHPPRDASVRVVGKALVPVRDVPGVTVDGAALEARIRQALGSTTVRRTLPVPTRVTPAKVTAADLPARFRDYIVVRRSAFRLDYFHGFRLVRSYPIAVGMQGLETPAGLYEIQEKETNPVWHVPNSPWAGDKAGQTIPPGPDDPIKARWMGFDGSAGIHGTDDVSSLGSQASHGCVRMAIPDVEDLYRRVPLHSPVRVE